MTRPKLQSVALRGVLAVLLTACGGGSSPPPPSANAHVSLVFEDGTAFAYAGADVSVDGVVKGRSDVDGRCDLVVDSGPHELRAMYADSVAGALTFDPSAGADAPIVMSMDGAVVVGTLTSVDLVDQVLPAAASSLTLAIHDQAGASVSLASVLGVTVSDIQLDQPTDVGSLLAIAPGALVITDLTAFRSAAMGFLNGVHLAVSGVTDAGRGFEATLDFRIGRMTLDVTLAAPPSDPTLGVEGRAVRAALIGTDLARTLVSDASGHVRFSDLPLGTYEVRAEAASNGTVYTGAATLALNASRAVRLFLLAAADVAAGRPAYADLGLPAMVPLSRAPERLSAANSTTRPTSLPGAQVATATAGAQGARIVGMKTIRIARGSATLSVRYEVSTAEYPEYVLAQSIFNDNWDVAVLAPDGSHVFSIQRNVNSQLYVDPVWRADGTTGIVTKAIDVAALTTSADVDFLVVVSATNVGDSILPTTVSATIDPGSFEIIDLRLSDVTPNYSCGAHGYAQTEQNRVSIPWSGFPQNVDHRYLEVRLAGRPAGSMLQNVKVELVNARTNATLMTVVDSGPGPLVQELAPDRLHVRATHGPDNPSTLGGTSPAPAHEILYRLTVTVSGGSPAVGPAGRDSRIYYALWQLPPGLIGRFPCEDGGGDQWTARGAAVWITNRVGLLTRLNDVSGEHARNLGHASHQLGTDLDIFQFATLGSGGTGTENYLALAALVRKALDGDAAAKSSVTSWFEANRSGLALLAADADVELVYVGNGLASNLSLPSGWEFALLREGTITAGTKSLSIGAWASPPTKVQAYAGHESHHHVKLRGSIAPGP